MRLDQRVALGSIRNHLQSVPPMQHCVACSAKRNEVLLRIIAGAAAQFPMVNLEMRQRTAALAPPSVPA